MVVKVPWKLIIFVLLLTVLTYCSYVYYEKYMRVIPDELLNKSLATTLASSSFRYVIDSRIVVDNNERILSQITGEKINTGDFHITGKMTEQEIEAYQIKDTTYIRDPVTTKWMVISGNNLLDQELFMTEINPLAMFNFESVGELQYLGKEKLDTGKVYVLQCKPVVKNKFLERFWQEYSYKLWIGRKDCRLNMAEIKATSKADPQDKLVLTLKIKNYGQKIEFQPPITN